MKNKFMATAAIVAILAATGAARADTSDIKALKAQSAALKKQNAALEKRLNKLEKKQSQAQAAQPVGQPAPNTFVGMVTKGPLDVITDDGPICWHGVCVFGTLDAGVGYASHGTTNSGGFYAGDTLIQKMYNHGQFGIMPSGLSQTSLGIKGSEELLPGLSGVFYANTGINPQSGQLANAPGSQVANNGVPLRSQSLNIDGTRGGQAFNDQLYAGLSSATFGQLTFGRQKTFSNDMIAAYDPAGGAYNYSLIGFSGSPVAGLGFTDLGRIDDTLKYRVVLGPLHFGAMYKFADGSAGSSAVVPGTATAPNNGAQCGAAIGTACATRNDGYQFDLGGAMAGFEGDVVYSHFNQALTYGTQGAAALGAASTTLGLSTLSGTAADIDSVAVFAKYTVNQWKFYAGYAHDALSNPKDPLGAGANVGQGDYSISSINNSAYPNTRIIQTAWTGAKYAWDPKTEITVAYYYMNQNTFGDAKQDLTCGNVNSNMRSGNCGGAEQAVSAYVDYHFTKRFDVYGGIMVSGWNGGWAGQSVKLDGTGLVTNSALPNFGGALSYVNIAPTVGARFTF